MKITSVLKYSLLAALLVLLFAAVAGAILGQPMGPAYVETGSMEPTIEAGDGFIAVPTALAGEVTEGDIVVFDAININDGDIVTHRIVDETEEGYITRGDANVVTDQDGVEPPVSEAQIEAKALTVGDYVVVIPNLGTIVLGVSAAVGELQQQLAVILGTRAVLGTQGLSYVLIGFGVITYLISAAGEQMNGSQSRDTSRSSGRLNPIAVIAVMTVVLIAVLSATMLAPAGVHQFEFVSSESGAAGPDVIQQGTTEEVEYRIPSNGQIPVVAVVTPATDDITVDQSTVYVPGNDVASVSVEITAPPETGVHAEAIVEYRYLAVLPMSFIIRLYTIHPLLPTVVINMFISGLFIVFAVFLIGTDPIRIGRRQPNVPLTTRIRRRLE